MHRRFWIRKKPPEIAYSRKPLAIHNMLKFRTQPLSPGHILLRFFIDRNPLRQPARHAIVSLLQRNHMHKLVPQNLLPVHRAWWSRSRRIHRDQPPKTNAQMPRIARQPNRPHHKHIVIVKHLHHHGRVQLNIVLSLIVQSRFIEQPQQLIGHHLGFLPGQLQLENTPRYRHKTIDRIGSFEQIIRPHTIWIGSKNPLQLASRLGIFSQPQQIIRQQQTRLDIFCINFQRTRLKSTPFFKSVLPRRNAPGNAKST